MELVRAEKKVGSIHFILNRLLARNERIMQEAVNKWFALTVKQIRADLTTKYIRKDVVDELTDWDKLNYKGEIIVKSAVAPIVEAGGVAGYKIVGNDEIFDLLNEDAVKQVDAIGAKMVREVNEETKKAIRFHIKQGIDEGKGMTTIARELRPLVGLTERQVQSVYNFRALLEEKGFSPKVIDRRVGVYERKTHRRRALMIARTETANAQNAGYCISLEQTGIEEVEFSAVSGACKICRGLDGKKYPVREARGIIAVHPFCRCAMLPVIGGNTLFTPMKKK